jgi:glycosyltransferase involved in cell wall biosynthesis
VDREAAASHDDQCSQQPSFHPNIGAVVIGRNEGNNLARCLQSIGGCGTIVYVDSSSTDGSVVIAANLGVEVIELDMSIPFTAARARNAGFRWLCSLNAGIEYVQFVDGDCEIIPGWIPRAIEFLEANSKVAAICGRRLERYPEASIYNAMCHREWDTPIGESNACGGDAIMRASAFRAIGGFADGQVAHEEPELCSRLRRAGWRIWRIDQPMTLHDAAIYRFRQFYNRSRRAGFGITQCLIGSECDIDPGGRAIIRRALAWSMILPIATLLSSALLSPFAALTFLIYPAQVVRHAINNRQGVGGGLKRRLQVSAVSMLGKFAVTHGCIEFIMKDVMGIKKTEILYK